MTDGKGVFDVFPYHLDTTTHTLLTPKMSNRCSSRAPAPPRTSAQDRSHKCQCHACAHHSTPPHPHPCSRSCSCACQCPPPPTIAHQTPFTPRSLLSPALPFPNLCDLPQTPSPHSSPSLPNLHTSVTFPKYRRPPISRATPANRTSGRLAIVVTVFLDVARLRGEAEGHYIVRGASNLVVAVEPVFHVFLVLSVRGRAW